MHFEHQGEPIILLLDVVEVPRSHSGANLAVAFAEILEEFGIADKVSSLDTCSSRSAGTHLSIQCLGIACDNASNNDTMIDSLAERLPDFDGQKGRVRCFLHILNLVAKSLLRQFDTRTEDKNSADAGDRELAGLAEGLREFLRAESESPDSLGAGDGGDGENGDLEDDPADDFDEVEKMSPKDREKFEEEVRPLKLVLVKVRDRPSSRSVGCSHVCPWAIE